MKLTFLIRVYFKVLLILLITLEVLTYVIVGDVNLSLDDAITQLSHWLIGLSTHQMTFFSNLETRESSDENPHVHSQHGKFPYVNVSVCNFII